MEVQSVSTINKIYKELDYNDANALVSFIDTYVNDERGGVATIVDKAIKKHEALLSEYARTDKMYEFEKKYQGMGSKYICGIDEVGRGPLAGPVVACAVILPANEQILFLNDSKQLSKKKREELYDIIIEKAVAVGIGISSEKVIDEINILQATYKAMQIAVSNLSVTPDLLLNDAVKIPDIDIKQVPIIKGDTLSASIAAASIVAKVTRDRIMEQYDEVYPGYGFSKNSGYGAPAHIAQLKAVGPCDIHRRTFIKNFI